ncbi:hypothetical protein PCASD_02527 [Puccinia coronata f. sp. avenae]|uniref:Uncharacterized protein n=2 Tax=Puccinia coronata f. sp. avenae TaxID=200324 RepID=A0A2N5VM59_9BASI|nr:hypothetical protein PCASD_02527 [Puccinia coronata f. sp. avenae]
MRMIGPPFFSAYVLTRDQVLIYHSFARLLQKFQDKIGQFESIPKGTKVSPVFASEVNRIKEILVPLPRKLCQMCDMLFRPPDFGNLEAPQLRAGIVLLVELEEILDQIAASISLFWILDQPQLHSSQPIYHREIKRHRCQRTQSKLVDLLKTLAELLHLYRHRVPISEMRLILDLREPARVAWGEVIKQTHHVANHVEGLIQWLNLSDLGIVQDQWQAMVQELDDLLEEVVRFTHFNLDIRSKPLLAYVPILKLARLFFNKMSKITNGEPHPISQMCPDQLLDLFNATLLLPGQLKGFFHEIIYQFTPQRDGDPLLAFDLINHFQLPINILNNFLALQGSNPDSSQDLYEKFLFWYAAWQSQLFRAVMRFFITYRDMYSTFLIGNVS